nr:hypothetical protein Ade03nite_08710 [Actinoplanes derwentensis]
MGSLDLRDDYLETDLPASVVNGSDIDVRALHRVLEFQVSDVVTIYMFDAPLRAGSRRWGAFGISQLGFLHGGGSGGAGGGSLGRGITERLLPIVFALFEPFIVVRRVGTPVVPPGA